MKKYLFCLSCLILMLAGCGRKAEEKAVEKSIEQATGANADVDLTDNGMKISGKTEEGDFSLTSGEGIEVPDDFPSDVFVYKPSSVNAVVNLPQGRSLTLTTGDDSKTVLEAYKREMTAKGWSEKMSMNMGNQAMFSFEKEGRVAQITVGREDDETQIVMVVGKNQ